MVFTTRIVIAMPRQRLLYASALLTGCTAQAAEGMWTLDKLYGAKRIVEELRARWGSAGSGSASDFRSPFGGLRQLKAARGNAG